MQNINHFLIISVPLWGIISSKMSLLFTHRIYSIRNSNNKVTKWKYIDFFVYYFLHFLANIIICAAKIVHNVLNQATWAILPYRINPYSFNVITCGTSNVIEKQDYIYLKLPANMQSCVNVFWHFWATYGYASLLPLPEF